MNIKNRAVVWSLVRGTGFALLTFLGDLLFILCLLRAVSGCDKPLAVLGYICLAGAGLWVWNILCRQILETSKIPEPEEMIWPIVWAVITYAVSGCLVGGNCHTQFLEAFGIQANFWGVLAVTGLIVWPVCLNGFTFIAKAMVAWEDNIKRLPILAGIILWGLAILITWLVTWCVAIWFPQITPHWPWIVAYWVVSILLSWDLRGVVEPSLAKKRDLGEMSRSNPVKPRS